MRNAHLKVPATAENCERDHKAKLELNEEFKHFERLVLREAKKSAEVQELLVPLAKLRSAIIIGAHGRHLVPLPLPKKSKRS